MCVAGDGGWQCSESEQSLETLTQASPGGTVAGMDSDH